VQQKRGLTELETGRRHGIDTCGQLDRAADRHCLAVVFGSQGNDDDTLGPWGII